MTYCAKCGARALGAIAGIATNAKLTIIREE
jgi:hypothetical protein